MRSFLPHSFQRRLALMFAGIACLVGLPAALYLHKIYSDQLIADRGQVLADFAQRGATVLSENLHERQREIEYLAELPALQADPIASAEARFSMVGLQKSHPYFTWIGYANAEGVVQIATADRLLGQSVSARPWFQHGQQGSFVGDLHQALLLAKFLPARPGDGPVRFIDFAAPVRDGQGRVRGVVAAHAHWDWAAQTIAPVSPQHARADRLELFIVNNQNQVIYPEGMDEQLRAPAPPSTDAAFFLDAWGTGGTYLTASAAIREVTPGRPLGWRVVVRQPAEHALRDVYTLGQLLGGTVLLAAAAFLGIAWWSSSRVSRPLRDLAGLARRIEHGDETVRLELAAGSSEIRQLASALQGMATRLIQNKAALADSNAVLERRVQERTAELERLNDELRLMARRDALSGLSNRLAANERLRDEYLRLQRGGSPYAVILLDIDLFKRVNDTFGHPVGDRVIEHVARTLTAALRESDFVARFGGEEFLVLLPATGMDDACMVAEKIRQAIAGSAVPPAGRLTVSLGVAAADAGHANEDVALQQADQALYAAKRDGRNRVSAAPADAGMA